VANGGTVLQGNAVRIAASAKDGYVITGITLKKADGTVMDITSADGTFVFAMKGDTEVTAKASKLISVSDISYGVEGEGSLTASSDGQTFESGASVEGSVRLEAAPAEGYVLKEWRITTGKSTSIVAANGAETYEFGPYAQAHNIVAVFAAETDPSVCVNIATSVSGGGRLVIIDTEGKSYEADSNGNVCVNIGKSLIIKAVPDAHHSLKCWTMDYEGVDKSVTEIKYNVYEPMSIGAEFYAPVKYRVEFGSSDAEMGQVTSDIDNGDKLIPGADVTLTARASEGYRVAGWKIQRGRSTETEEYTVEDGLLTEAEYTLKDVQNACKVTAVFVKIEEFSVSVNVTGDGEAYLEKSDGSHVGNGQTVAYADKLTLKSDAGIGSHTASLKLNGKTAETGQVILANSDITVDAAYKLNNYDIRRTVKGYGSVQILNENQEKITEDYAAHGDKLTIRFVPEDGSVVDSAEINGKSFENGKTITVTEDLDISAVFKMDLSKAALTLPEAVYWYTGKEICPDVSATVNGHRVPANAFTVVYENNVETGAATVNLIAVEDGTCTGKSESVTFQIRDHVVSNTDRINRALRETVSSKKVSVRWGRVPTADGYDVYVAKCGSKFPSKAVRSVRGNDALSVSFSKINGKKISSKNNYKAYVKAFRTVDGKKTYIAKSRDLHAAGPKTSRTDAWKVTAAKNTIFLKPGNAASAKANIIKNNTSKKLLGSDR